MFDILCNKRDLSGGVCAKAPPPLLLLMAPMFVFYVVFVCIFLLLLLVDPYTAYPLYINVWDFAAKATAEIAA